MGLRYPTKKHVFVNFQHEKCRILKNKHVDYIKVDYFAYFERLPVYLKTVETEKGMKKKKEFYYGIRLKNYHKLSPNLFWIFIRHFSKYRPHIMYIHLKTATKKKQKIIWAVYKNEYIVDNTCTFFFIKISCIVLIFTLLELSKISF